MIHLLVFFGNTCELFDLKGLFVCFAVIMQKVMNILWVLFENAGINEIDKNDRIDTVYFSVYKCECETC